MANSFQISNISNKICNSLPEGGKCLVASTPGQVSLGSNCFALQEFFSIKCVCLFHFSLNFFSLTILFSQIPSRWKNNFDYNGKYIKEKIIIMSFWMQFFINKMLELTSKFQLNVKKLFCSLGKQGKRYFENSVCISPFIKMLSLISVC